MHSSPCNEFYDLLIYCVHCFSFFLFLLGHTLYEAEICQFCSHAYSQELRNRAEFICGVNKKVEMLY